MDERISIALILINDNNVFFKYSPEKIKILKDLLPLNSYNLIKNSIQNIDRYFLHKQSNEVLANYSERMLDMNYFEYLSRYANNLLVFSKPQKIEIRSTLENINILFEKFIFKLGSIEKLVELDFIKDVKRTINPILKDNVNFNVKVDKSIIKSLDIPTSVSFIGQNGHKVIGEVVDFNKEINHLENKLRSVLYVRENMLQEDPYSSAYIIYKAPLIKNSENNEIYKSLKNNSQLKLDFKTIDEINKVKTFLDKNNVKP
ncbi:MAG TPA: hypothetical protein VFW78_11185, partial [Bacteroidia bacterium]|nr:hypothetical protein [Bacteroidia bacterium]